MSVRGGHQPGEGMHSTSRVGPVPLLCTFFVFIYNCRAYGFLKLISIFQVYVADEYCSGKIKNALLFSVL